MQFCWIGLQIEAKNAGAVVLQQGFSTRICNLRRLKYALRILETHPSCSHRFGECILRINGRLLHGKLVALRESKRRTGGRRISGDVKTRHTGQNVRHSK
jgi:hypothetical protein